MSYHLGVDLGTTYTAAAIGRDGRVEPVTLGRRSVAVPSVVCLVGDRMLVGEPAARRAITEPGTVAREFKRRVGDPTPLLLGGSPVSAELCMARMVEWVVAQVSETEGDPPATLALTHPANWGVYKLDLLRQALRHVGLTVDRFVPEPVAAATAYAAQRSLAPDTVVAIYDLGGGTFDAALVRAGEPGGEGARIVGRPDGLERLGGIDFDHAVFQHVLTVIDLDITEVDGDDPAIAAGLAQLREECVEAKEALSHETDVSIPVMLPQRHTEVRLTRSELETMIRPALDETLVAMRRTIASGDMPVDEVAAVLLVGGSSRIPLVGQLVTAELGRPIAVDARPKDTISLGAARVAMTAAGPTAAAPVPPPASAPEPLAAAATPAPGDPQTPAAAAEPPAAPLSASPAAPGPPMAAPAASSDAGGRRLVLAALTAIVVLVGAVAAVLLLTDDEPQAATPTTRADDTADDTSDDATTDTTGSDTSTDDGSTGEDDGPTVRPLPGDGWNDEARTVFVEDCSAGMVEEQPTLGAMGVDMDAVCGCVYDDVSQSHDFATFSEEWSSDAFDPNSEFGQDVTNSFMSCALSAQG